MGLDPSIDKNLCDVHVQMGPDKLGLRQDTATESVVTNFSVPSYLLVEGHVSWLRTVHPLLTLNSFSKWFLPLEKRKTLSSIMDGHQKRGMCCSG